MKISEARYRANRKYQDANIRQIKFGFNIKIDADILAKLDSVPNKLRYIKDLIRSDIKKDSEK
jgi:hypothetical protein